MQGVDFPGDDKQSQILRGAAAVFAEAGYEGASMSRIAARAGVSKGTLYNYFVGKRELFAAFMQRECTGRIALIFDEAEDGAPPEQTLTRVCRRLLDVLLSDNGLLVYRMAVAEAGKFPELAEIFYAVGPQRALARMTGWIERQVEAGRLVVPDPEFAAEQLFGLVQTRLLIRRRLRLVASVSDAEIDRVVSAGVSLFMRGYGPGTPAGGA